MKRSSPFRRCQQSKQANRVRLSVEELERHDCPSLGVWEPVPMVTAAARAAGIAGGEGGQVITAIASSSNDQFLLMGTDVGGIYRSVDGGNSWMPANVGYRSLDVRAAAIDPNNPNYALVSAGWYRGGIYRTTNQGASWTQTSKAAPTDGSLLIPAAFNPHEVTYDPTSATPGNPTPVAYWLRDADHGVGGGLMKTTNGGQSWSLVNNSIPGIGGLPTAPPSAGLWSPWYSSVVVNPRNGNVWIGIQSGLYYSTDGGQTFTQVTLPGTTGGVTGLDIVKNGSGAFWAVTTDDGLVFTSSNGSTFTKVAQFPNTGNLYGGTTVNGNIYDTYAHYGAGKPVQFAYNIRISPLNANHLALTYATGYFWDQPLFYSTDGGAHWYEGNNTLPPPQLGYTMDPSSSPNLPADQLKPHADAFVWSNTNPDTLWAENGLGLAVVKSTNDGKTFIWSNNGYNGINVGAGFSFNPINPNIVVMSAGDWGSFLSTDGGSTWTYIDAANPIPPYRFTAHAGYAFDANHFFTYYAYSSVKKFVTRNIDPTTGQIVWKVPTVNGQPITPSPSFAWDSVLGDPYDPTGQTAFWDGYVTRDMGVTWSQMTGVARVRAYGDLNGRHTLFGSEPNGSTDKVVMSQDDGRTWTSVVTASASYPYVLDLAYGGGKLYITSGSDYNSSRLFIYDFATGTMSSMIISMPADLDGLHTISSVAVDPTNPNLVYAGRYSDFNSEPDVFMSTDGGATWSTLSLTTTDIANGVTGLPGPGASVIDMHVNPVTHNLWVTGHGTGVWRYVLNPVAPTSPAATARSNEVTLRWTASTGADSYNIYRSTTSGGETLYQSGITTTSFTDTGVINGTTYYYKVTAVNAAGESGKSSEITATPTTLTSSITEAKDASGQLYSSYIGTDGAAYVKNVTTGSGWTSLGGNLQSIAATNRSDGAIRLFGIGSDGSVYNSWETSPSSGAFSAWTSLGGQVKSIVPLLDTGNNYQMVFAISSDNNVWAINNTGPGTAYGSWYQITTGGGVTQIAADNGGDGRIRLYYVQNGTVYQGYQTAVGSTSYGWVNLGGPSTSKGTGVKSIAVVTAANNYQYAFAIGLDDSVYFRNNTGPGTSWSSWSNLGGQAKAIAVALPAGGNGAIEIYVIGMDNALYRMTQQSPDSNSFSGWNYLGGHVTEISALVPDYIFAVSSDDDAVWSINNNGWGTSWGSWKRQGGSVLR